MASAQDFWWATPIVGIMGVIVALASIVANRRIARMRATLDLVERTESSEHYRKLSAAFRELAKNNENVIGRLKNPQTESDKDFVASIFAYLNHYELISLGCHKGILDESFYAQWMRTQLVRDWHTAKEFIFFSRGDPTTGIEADPPALYIQFQTMARRFEMRTERGCRVRHFSGRARKLLNIWHRRNSVKTAERKNSN